MTLTRSILGLQAAHVNDSFAVSGVTSRFDAADWSGFNVGTGGGSVSPAGASLVFSKSGVSGTHILRYTPVDFNANGVVIACQLLISTGGTAGLAARASDGNSGNDRVDTNIPFGFTGSYGVYDRAGNVSSGSSTVSGVNRGNGAWRLMLAVQDGTADVRLETTSGSSGPADQDLTLANIDAAGIKAGLVMGSGSTGTLTTQWPQFVVLRGRYLTVNGPATGNWRVRLRNSGGSLILTSNLQSGGVVQLDILANRNAWIGTKAPVGAQNCISLATQIEVYDDDLAAVIEGPETPTERVWGGDVWSFGAAPSGGYPAARLSHRKAGAFNLLRKP